MRILAFVALICCVLTSREASAQEFFYAPGGYSDYSGVGLGNGVGFGYGIGLGVSPNLLNSSITDTYIPPFQELCDSNPSFISRGAVTPSPVLPNPSRKKPKVTPTKKSVSKAIPIKAKPAKQGAGK